MTKIKLKLKSASEASAIKSEGGDGGEERGHERS